MPSIRQFYDAAIRGDLKKVKIYIKDVDVNIQDKFNRTALYLVISKNYLSILENHLSVIDFLLESGANIYLKENHAENTPLDMAKLSSNTQVLELFLKRKLVDIDSINKLILELSSINNDEAMKAHDFLVKQKFLHKRDSLLATQPVYGDEDIRIVKIKQLLSHLTPLRNKDLNKVLDSAIDNNNIKTAKVLIEFILSKNKSHKIISSVNNNEYLYTYWKEQVKKINDNQIEGVFFNKNQQELTPCVNEENRKMFFSTRNQDITSDESDESNRLASSLSTCCLYSR